MSTLSPHLTPAALLALAEQAARGEQPAAPGEAREPAAPARIAVDWSRLVTAEDKATAALAAEREGMVVSRMQAKGALLGAGLLDQVEAVVAAADPMTRLAWAEAIEFRRTSPTILALAAALSLSDEQVDDLFRAAAGIAA